RSRRLVRRPREAVRRLMRAACARTPAARASSTGVGGGRDRDALVTAALYRPGLLEEPEGARALRGMDSGPAVELSEQVADVHIDGALAEEEPRRDLPVRETFGREPQHLHLAA